MDSVERSQQRLSCSFSMRDQTMKTKNMNRNGEKDKTTSMKMNAHVLWVCLFRGIIISLCISFFFSIFFVVAIEFIRFFYWFWNIERKKIGLNWECRRCGANLFHHRMTSIAVWNENKMIADGDFPFIQMNNYLFGYQIMIMLMTRPGFVYFG